MSKAINIKAAGERISHRLPEDSVCLTLGKYITYTSSDQMR